MSGLEIPGLVAAIGEMAALGIKAAAKLYELRVGVARFAHDAERLRLQVDSMVALLGQVREQLVNSTALASRQQLLRDIHVSVKSCGAVLNEIQQSAGIALSHTVGQSMWRRMKFTIFNGTEVQNYRDELSHCSVTLLGFLCLLGQSIAYDNHQHIVALFNSMRAVDSNATFMCNLDQLDSIGTEAVGEQQSVRTPYQQTQDSVSYAVPGTNRATSAYPVGHYATTSESVQAARNPSITTTPQAVAGHRHEQDQQQERAETLAPSFSMWLAKAPLDLGESWVILAAPVPDTAILFFLETEENRRCSFTSLNINLVQLIFEHVQAQDAQLVAIKAVEDRRRLTRFLKRKLLSVDFVTKPSSANQNLMIQCLKDRAFMSFHGIPQGYSQMMHQGIPPGSSLPTNGAQLSSVTLKRIKVLFESDNSMLQSLLVHAYLHETDHDYANHVGPSFATRTLLMLQALVERWLLSNNDLQQAGNMLRVQLDTAVDTLMANFRQTQALKRKHPLSLRLAKDRMLSGPLHALTSIKPRPSWAI